MSELSDRVSRLEGSYEHVATKADIAELKAEIASIDGQLDILIWAIPLTVAVVTLLVQWLGPHRKPSGG